METEGCRIGCRATVRARQGVLRRPQHGLAQWSDIHFLTRTCCTNSISGHLYMALPASFGRQEGRYPSAGLHPLDVLLSYEATPQIVPPFLLLKCRTFWQESIPCRRLASSLKQGGLRRDRFFKILTRKPNVKYPSFVTQAVGLKPDRTKNFNSIGFNHG